MTPKTFFTELQNTLKLLVWTGTSSKIFGDNVYIVADTPLSHLNRFQSPSCFIMDLGGQLDDEHPNLLFQKFSLMLFVENNNNVWGEGVMLSSNRTINTSQGAGLFDIEEVLIPSLIKTVTLNAVKIQVLEKSKSKQATISGNLPNVNRIWNFSCQLALI